LSSVIQFSIVEKSQFYQSIVVIVYNAVSIDKEIVYLSQIDQCRNASACSTDTGNGTRAHSTFYVANTSNVGISYAACALVSQLCIFNACNLACECASDFIVGRGLCSHSNCFYNRQGVYTKTNAWTAFTKTCPYVKYPTQTFVPHGIWFQDFPHKSSIKIRMPYETIDCYPIPMPWIGYVGAISKSSRVSRDLPRSGCR
jgi:hypothetical protein